jgi:RimJ/RimL family protein N-acetyltransferase
MPPLADDSVLLRRWREADVPGMAMAFGDPLTQRFSWTQPTAYTEDDARDHFDSLEPARLRGDAVQFALVAPTDEGVVLGSVSLYDISVETDLRAGQRGLSTRCRPLRVRP